VALSSTSYATRPTTYGPASLAPQLTRGLYCPSTACKAIYTKGQPGPAQLRPGAGAQTAAPFGGLSPRLEGARGASFQRRAESAPRDQVPLGPSRPGCCNHHKYLISLHKLMIGGILKPMPTNARKAAIPKGASRHPYPAPPSRSAAAGPRIAILHRVSTLDQDPTLARGELEAWADRCGGHVVLLIEEAASGAWNARPGLQRLLDHARRGLIDVVVVWALDRFGRSALDVLGNIQHLADAGVRFVCTSQGIDIKPGGDAMSRLMLTVLAAVAEFERSLIRERTRLGLAKARARGQRLGRPKLAHPSAEKVRELRKRGRSWNQIAAALSCSVGVARLRAAEATRTTRRYGGHK
jgi:putative DNA-invertase from lambdoid prophage Rac